MNSFLNYQMIEGKQMYLFQQSTIDDFTLLVMQSWLQVGTFNVFIFTVVLYEQMVSFKNSWSIEKVALHSWSVIIDNIGMLLLFRSMSHYIDDSYLAPLWILECPPPGSFPACVL
jgi:hypothetical protein